MNTDIPMKKYLDLDFLQPLISCMVVKQPERRVGVDKALKLLEDICSSTQNSHLRWRLRGRDEPPPIRVIFDTIDVAKQGLHHLNRLLR